MHTSHLLNEDEAAIRLGITKGLLYAYVRHAPKKHLGDTRTLKPISRDKEIWFTVKDLDEWDEYLQQPWSSSGKKRLDVPRYVDEYLEVECGGKCARCGKGRGLENAHIESYATSLNNYHHNLIRLCKGCHSDYDSGLIAKEEILELKAALVQKIRESLQHGKQPFSTTQVHCVPEPDPLFVGRKEELSILSERLMAKRIVIIEGIGGIGKTQLLARALQYVSDVPTIWFDVEGYRSFADLQLAILPALTRVGVDVGNGASLYDALDTQPLRIVFDGLDRIPPDESDAVVDFLHDIIRLTRRPKIVLTTQIEISSLSGVYKLLIPPLSGLESRLLISLGCEGDDGLSLNEDDAAWLTDFCEGHSLSLRAVIGLLRYFKRPTTVVERLITAGAKEVRDHTRKEQKRSSSLQVCLKAAYSCFNQEQRRLLLYLSNHPAGCPEPLAKSWHKFGDYVADLAELRRFFFVDVYPDRLLRAERLYVLNPVRQFVKGEWDVEVSEEAASIQMDAVRTLMLQALVLDNTFLQDGTQPEQAQYGLVRLETELPNYIEALRYSEESARLCVANGEDAKPYHELIAGLASGLSRYFFIRGLLLQGLYLIVPGIEALMALGRYQEVATQLMMLSNMQARLHDHAGHIQTIGTLVELAGKTSDSRIFALAALGVGDMLKHDGKFSEAVSSYERAADYFREELASESSSTSDEEKDERYLTGMLGLALASLAEVQHRLCQPQEAIKSGLEAVRYIEKIGDQTNLGMVWHELGNCYAESGDMTHAVEAYKKALELFLKLGYREYIGNAICEMGEAVVEGGFITSLNSLLTEQVLGIALVDVKEYLKMQSEALNRSFADDGSVMRKLFGTIKLISFTDKSWMLKDWADEIGNEILNPLFAAEETAYDPQRAAFAECLFRVLSPARWLGVISSEGERYSDEQIFTLCGLCHDLASYWIGSKPFDWLAAFLSHRGIRKNIDSVRLYEAFVLACQKGDPGLFRLE